jgi:hypothetical protein
MRVNGVAEDLRPISDLRMSTLSPVSYSGIDIELRMRVILG